MKLSQEPAVYLKKPITDRIRMGHPWIYRDALETGAEFSDGTIVRILDMHDQVLAKGIYDATSPIAVRVYTLDPATPLDDALKKARLASALHSRLQWLDRTETTAFRLCHGEADFVPGLIIDLYDQAAVVQFDGKASEQFWLPNLVEHLQEVLSPDRLSWIYWKRRTSQGGGGTLLFGESLPKELEMKEHGVSFLVNIAQGQKTGFFLDQRENRLLIRKYAPGKYVLNGFCYTGGFSVQAALFAAKRVVSVDSAKEAIETTKRNFLKNHLPLEPHGFFAQDLFIHLRQAVASGLTYDLVIMDPPSFAHAQESVPKAVRAYQDLFGQSLRVVKAGGILAASSCSSHINMEQFLSILGQTALKAGRMMKFLEVRGQPADHPSLPAFPEGRYLKFVLAQID